jgi:hypothetical protein
MRREGMPSTRSWKPVRGKRIADIRRLSAAWRLYSGQHLLNVQGRQATYGVKIQGAGRIPGEYAVQHERVHVKIQIEASPKSLDHGHRTAATIRDAAVPRASAQETEHRTDEHGDNSAAHVVIPRLLVPRAVGQTQDPLPHRHVGEHVMEQVGGSLSHSAAATTWTQGPALARKRDQPIVATIATAKPRESAGQPATLQKLSKLLLHEAGQAFPSRRRAACTRKVSK